MSTINNNQDQNNSGSVILNLEKISNMRVWIVSRK